MNADNYSGPASLVPGLSIGGGRFTLTRALGRGGMGVVWLGQDTRLGEQVALKFLPPEVAADAVALNDLRRETVRSHKLTHPNIIRIHDFHEQSYGVAFISMEFVDGPTLSAWRLQQTNQVLSWEQLAPLVHQLCAALDYAHGESVVHRDLKPANVMLDARGRLKLADFGIAAVVSDSASRVSMLGTSGTLAYMSPQQLTGKRPSVTDDIYALGATLYELLTSKPPFYTGDLTHQVLHELPEPVEERLATLGIQNAIPPDVAALIMACLAKDPTQRPQSAAAVAEWIGFEVGSQRSGRSLTTDVFQEAAATSGEASAGRAASGRKLLWAGAIFAGVLLLAVAGWFLAHRSSATKSISEGQAAPDRANATTLVTRPDPAPERAESAPGASEASENGFVSLFNGRDLTGWDGDPNFWSVQNDCIVGEVTRQKIPNGNTFLIWRGGEPGDFELRVKCRMPSGNSGIQFRSRLTDQWKIVGYQAEVYTFDSRFGEGIFGGLVNEPSPLLASCGEKVVYNASGQKQITGNTGYTTAQVRAAFSPEGWNDHTIIAEGRRLILKLNGLTTVDFIDDRPSRALSGLIALQLHRNRGEPMRVEFKEIQLKRSEPATAARSSGPASNSGWTPLFDGKTLSGWTALDGGDWSVASGGVIVGKTPRSHLLSPGTYRNLEFKAEAKISRGGNSGMYFRANRSAVRPNGFPEGYEAQIENTAKDPQKTGSLYNFNKVAQQYAQDDSWFTQHIIAIGNRIVIKVNNRIVTDYVDAKNTYTSGHLAFQNNTPGSMSQFRNVLIKPLPEDSAAAWEEARKDIPELAR